MTRPASLGTIPSPLLLPTFSVKARLVRFLSVLAFVTIFPLDAAILADQHPLAVGSASGTCTEQNQFNMLLTQGNDDKLPTSTRARALRIAVSICPRDPAGYQALGVFWSKQQNFEQALYWVRRGLKVSPHNLKLAIFLGATLLSAGRPNEALQIFKSLPPNAETEFYLGMAYRALGNHEASRDALSRSFRMGNHDPYVLYTLIEQDHDLHDKAAGLKDFQTFYRNFPDSAWMHLLLGNAYQAEHNGADAEREFQKAVHLDPQLPIAHFSLGLISFNRGDYAKAIQHFRNEIEIDPSFGLAYLYLGTALRRVGKNNDALPYLEEAVARNPNLDLAYIELASAQIEAGQIGGGLKTLRMGEQRFPTDAAFAARLSQLLRSTGDVQAAQKQASLAESLSRQGNPVIHGASLEKVGKDKINSTVVNLGKLRACLGKRDVQCALLALSELRNSKLQSDPDYLNLKAQALDLEGRQKEALAAVHEALAVSANQPEYWMTQGKIYQGMGKQGEAIESFLRAAQMESKPVEPTYYIGMSFFLLGNYYNRDEYYIRAAQHFRKALELDPHFDKAQFMLGAVNSVEFRLTQAKMDFEKALQLKPTNPYYLLHYGILLRRLGDATGALREMKLAEQMDPSYAQTYFNLGSLYFEMKNYRDAMKQLEAGLRLDPKFAEAYYTLGRVYHQLGMDAKSQEELHRFQQLRTQKRESGDPLLNVTSSETQFQLPRPQ